MSWASHRGGRAALQAPPRSGRVPPFWSGHAAARIVEVLKNLLEPAAISFASRGAVSTSAGVPQKIRFPSRGVSREGLDIGLYFCNYRNMQAATNRGNTSDVARYADMFSAMGTEPRLRIMQLLLSAHPEGLVVGEMQSELDIPNSTLSHHLDKLKNEELVNVRRESTFLRYTANTEALQELLQFLYAECCTRSKALKPQDIVQLCK